jgi:hypothetical protein
MRNFTTAFKAFLFVSTLFFSFGASAQTCLNAYMLYTSATAVSGTTVPVIVMNAQPSFTYTWTKTITATSQTYNLVATTPAIFDIATQSATYTVTVQGSGGCTNVLTSTVTVVSSLPIDIISFDAKTEGSASKLVWRTGEEKNVDFFILERSKNGRDFTEIAKMKSGAASKEYAFVDEKAFSGTSYYRLKMPENDGSKVMYSKTISVSAATKGTFKITPTLANDNITLELPANLDVISLHVTDFSGRIIKTIKTSSLQERVDVSDLAAGMYFIVAQSGVDKFTERFVKQ